MMPNELDAHRRTAATELGDISYLDFGDGPPALFVHVLGRGDVHDRRVADVAGNRPRTSWLMAMKYWSRSPCRASRPSMSTCASTTAAN